MEQNDAPDPVPIRPEATRPVRRVTPKVRFEVFKRDDFTCQYCGRKTPEVVLEIDHIVPVSAGGDNDPLNLTTSCWECNRGKGAELLDETAPVTDSHTQTILMLERERQLAEYNAVLDRVRAREDQDIAELDVFWVCQWEGSLTNAEVPYQANLRRWLRMFPKAAIKDAMELAIRYNPDRPARAAKYLAGILRNWREGRDGSGAPVHRTFPEGDDL